MEESRETTRLRRDWSSEAALEMKDEAESWSSLACSTTLPTSSSSFFADSDSPISSLLFNFLLFFFNSLEILTTDSYCNSNWRLAERPRNRQLYKNTKYTQSQREENEPKKKKEKGICFCYSLTVTHLFQFSRTLSHSFCSFWLWEREIHILLKLVLEPESRGRYHYPQLLFISTSLVHFTKQTNKQASGG